jgi:hypothetical protein
MSVKVPTLIGDKRPAARSTITYGTLPPDVQRHALHAPAGAAPLGFHAICWVPRCTSGRTWRCS